MKLRPATIADSELVYRIKKAALREYVDRTWGWDEAEQRRYHHSDFIPSGFQIIEADGEPIGVFVVRDFEDHLAVCEIYIHPSHQNRGMGTNLIKGVQADAKERGIPVRLRFLKTNPNAGRLYARLGFTVSGETPHHYRMEYRPDSSSPSREAT
jgi:ribosomal protein S18 acetylase RimI-like enzyme